MLRVIRIFSFIYHMVFVVCPSEVRSADMFNVGIGVKYQDTDSLPSFPNPGQLFKALLTEEVRYRIAAS